MSYNYSNPSKPPTDSAMEEPLNFIYEDTDSYQNEISEIYSYSEEPEFFSNRNAFEECMEDRGLPLTWKHMVDEQKQSAISHLMTQIEICSRPNRIKACRALAYLIQGNFGECLSLEEQALNSRENVFLLFRHGILQAFIHQLSIESAMTPKKDPDAPISQNDSEHSTNQLTLRIFNDANALRLILAVLCTITDTMYHTDESANAEQYEMRKQFIFEVQNPIDEDLLVVHLFQMLDKFCAGQAPHYPVRKITLLLWKVILLTLGGTEDLKRLKEKHRRLSKLDPQPDDTMEITSKMTPCIPPLQQANQLRSRPVLSSNPAVGNKRKVFKQPAFDDVVFAYAKECLLNSLVELNQVDSREAILKRNQNTEDDSNNITKPSDSDDDERTDPDNLGDEIDKNQGEEFQVCESFSSSSTPKPASDIDSGISDREEVSDNGVSRRSEAEPTTSAFPEFDFDLSDMPNPKNNDDTITLLDHSNEMQNSTKGSSLKLDVTPSADGSRSDVSQLYRGLPWAPKVRKADLSQHLTNIRIKFLGYELPNDLDTTFGLPEPIIEGINVMRKHLYVSLSEAQLEREEKIQRYPLTYGELNPDYNEEPAERLYQALLPRLPQYMIALLKILLAATTNPKYRTDKADSINITAEINPDVSSQSVVHLMKMTADSSRHEGIIIKAISAILLLLLKHFKVNHLYQFEYISQQLMFANCIPLILKFLSQDIQHYIVSSRSNISLADFPACVIGEPSELTADAIELSSFQAYSWRNMFSCINLVRVLNKLTKWKHSRIMMLVVFKSSQTLLKALSVRQTMFQLYVLKLLKVQLKFLGRQWKKNNMKLISPIYQKVRHRLTDDWAYSNDNEARPWDFQAEEFSLQNSINKFHYRRYKNIIGPLKLRNPSMSAMDLHNEEYENFIGKPFDLGEEERYDMFEAGKVVPYFAIAYEKWLEGEVFQRQIDWDKLLQCC